MVLRLHIKLIGVLQGVREKMNLAKTDLDYCGIYSTRVQ